MHRPTPHAALTGRGPTASRSPRASLPPPGRCIPKPISSSQHSSPAAHATNDMVSRRRNLLSDMTPGTFSNCHPVVVLLLVLSPLALLEYAAPSAGSEAPKTAGDVKKAVTASSLAALVNKTNRQIYLSADSSATGDGSSESSPLPAGTPDLFDKYVRQYGELTTFHLAPGTYLTVGSEWIRGPKECLQGRPVHRRRHG